MVFMTNRTENVGSLESLTNDDASWALSCAFLILTMQTGFAMLECGCVSSKNVANIMIKNVVDVSLGGLTYWMFGYGLSFGKPSNAFCGGGGWFFQHDDDRKMGSQYTHYFFQLSFATTATTIVSGAVAERMKLHAYMIFSLVNTVVYCFPASWAWNDTGFLRNMGFYDFAGVCIVHLCGGTSALVSVLMLGARVNRFEQPSNYEMSSPITCLTGMFMLMWAWLAFNAGSTFGVEGILWKVSALSAANTINGAIGGGIVALTYSMIRHHGKILVDIVINCTLGGLVGITGVCAVTSTWEAILIGIAAAIVVLFVMAIIEKLHIDDPVGAIPVHLGAGCFGTIAIGLFAKNNSRNFLQGHNGLFHGGGFYMLGAQLLGVVCVTGWSALLTFCLLGAIRLTLGIRVSYEEEILGADWVEHDLQSNSLGAKLAQAFKALDEKTVDEALQHMAIELVAKTQERELSASSNRARVGTSSSRPRGNSAWSTTIQEESNKVDTNAVQLDTGNVNPAAGEEHTEPKPVTP